MVFTKSIARIPLSEAKLKACLALELGMIAHDFWEAGGGWAATFATTGAAAAERWLQDEACSQEAAGIPWRCPVL